MPAPVIASSIYSDDYTKKRTEDGRIILEKTLRSEIDKEDVLERLQETLDNLQREKIELDARVIEIQTKISTVSKIK
jgi:hypothetical protein